MSHGMGATERQRQRQRQRQRAENRALSAEQRAALVLQRAETADYLKRLKADVMADVKRTGATVALLPAQAAADTAIADSESTGKLVRALPWLLGAGAAAFLLYIVTRKRKVGAA